ncbi:hypothetical protein [Lewinella sp. IMCC34183]|uniref:hypothetical protein n=1 Tax=Lewinella sp. IMCC34183 TaxID=2248762 RepID=UPI000E24CB86|nr:hypothetical protein [Lewinella sp. IMCC34183]
MAAGNILFITNYFPPRPAVAGRRLGQLAEWARHRYGAIYVIRADRGFKGADPPGLHVTALPARDLRTVAGGSGPAQTLPYDSLRRRLSGPLLDLRQSFPFLYLTDDGGPVYRREAYREAVRLVREKRITTILSSFRPWSDHLVARRLKREFPRLHWIADFRDIHADPIRHDVWWPALQRWWGRRVLREADEVWGVSRGQVEQLRKLFPGATVRRNSINELPPATTAPRTDRFTIVYTGSLYERLHTLAPLVDSLNALVAAGEVEPGEVELVYRGKDDALWKELTKDLNQYVHCNTRGYISPAAAQKLQRDAQVLLLLSWTGPDYYGVLTAKLYDYLSTGRPIMAIIKGPADPEIEEILTATHTGASFHAGKSPRGWLLECYLAWREGNGKLPWFPNLDALNQLVAGELTIGEEGPRTEAP